MNIYQISANNLASMNFVGFFQLISLSGSVLTVHVRSSSLHWWCFAHFFVFIPYEKINQSSAVLIEALVMS